MISPHFIVDSSIVGKDITAPHAQGYGSVIRIPDSEQAKPENLVPGPDVLLDDHSGYPNADYPEAIMRLPESAKGQKSFCSPTVGDEKASAGEQAVPAVETILYFRISPAATM